MPDNLTPPDNKEDIDITEPVEIQEILNSRKAPSLQTLSMLVYIERWKFLRDKINAEFSQLKTRQDKVTFLNKLLKKINVETTSKGEFDCSSNAEIKKLLLQAKEMGVDLKEDKFTYNKEERERLVDNFQKTVDEFNVSNDMQMQTIKRYTEERFESLQFARSILKSLHEMNMTPARGIK